MSNPFETQSAAAHAATIVAMIEAATDSPTIMATMQLWAQSMGGRADLTPMTPEGRLLYLLALTQRR